MTAPLAADRCVYGPVPSRRLGRSLGIDLVPPKTCTYDCVYCQLGRTTDKTVARQRWLEPSRIIAEVGGRLDTAPDVITLAGSGEPTLYDGIGELIAGIKDVTDTPVVVITNGSLLSLPGVRSDLARADIVMPSLDAPDSSLFALVNRPHPDLRFEDLIDGLVAFRSDYEGQVWLEVMLLAGVTGIDAEVERLATLAARMEPDRIQLNTAVRPPAESFVEPVSPNRLRELAAAFTPHADIIAPVSPVSCDGDASSADVVALLKRRPCAIADIATGLGIHHSEALKIVSSLVVGGAVESSLHGDLRYYVPTDPKTQHSSKEDS